MGENVICTPKVAGTQPSKNAEKAGLVKLLRKQFPLEMLLQLIGLKRSTFFYHLPEKVNNKNAEIEQKVAEIFHTNNGNYGYRRITLALRKIWTINHKKVQAIMQKRSLKGKCKRRKYHLYQGEVGKIADNLPGRNFQTTKSNEKWVTDVTEFKCAEGKLYLSPINDLFNEEIIAYDLTRTPNFEQISRMMAQAVAKLKGKKPILYSDQGWQYQKLAFRDISALHKVCREREITWIMGQWKVFSDD